MSISLKFAHFVSVARDYGNRFGTALKAGTQAAYEEMTIANARLVIRNAKECGVTAYNNITVENAKAKLNEAGIVLSQYKGRYIELINMDQQFAIANVAMINVAAFYALGKMANRFGQLVEFTFKPFRLGKAVALHAGFGYAIFKINQLFCQMTGFYMSDNTIKAITVGALIVRMIKQYNPETNSKFTSIDKKITKIDSANTDKFKNIENTVGNLIINLNNFSNQVAYQRDQAALKANQKTLTIQITALDTRLKEFKDQQDAARLARDSYIN